MPVVSAAVTAGVVIAPRALHPARPAVGQRLAVHGADRLPAYRRRHRRRRGPAIGGGLSASLCDGHPVRAVRVCFLAGVLDPPILPHLGRFGHRRRGHRPGTPGGVVRLDLAHHTLDRGRAGRSRGPRPHPRHGPGADRPIAVRGGQRARPRPTTYDLAVTSTLLGASRLPDRYLGVQHWADALGAAYFALLVPRRPGVCRRSLRWPGRDR